MARPTRPQPQIPSRPKIEIGSAGDVGEHLMALCFEEAVNRPSHCTLELDDWAAGDFRYSETPTVDFGVELSLALTAASGNPEPVFAGKLYGMGRRQSNETQPVLALEAFDQLQELSMIRRSRHFEEVGVADVVSQIASAHGLAAEVDLDDQIHNVIVQANESDLAFLARLLEGLDGEIWVADDSLHAVSHWDRPGAVVELKPQRDLFDLKIDAALGGQRTDVSVTGWDMVSKQPIVGTADPDSLTGELDGMLSGGALLSLIGAPGPDSAERIVHGLQSNPQVAERHAVARYADISRDFVTLRAEARGNAALRVGAKVDLVGAGLRFDGRYVVARVRHRFDLDRGYRCELEARRSGIER